MARRSKASVASGTHKVNVLEYAFVVLTTISALAPFYIMIIMSTYKTEELYTSIRLLPGTFLLENMKTVMGGGWIIQFFNSLKVSVLATASALASSCMAGFALSQYRFRLKKLVFSYVMASMMIPSGIGLIAFLVEMRTFGWVNSHNPLIWTWLSYPFGVYLMTQFMNSAVPREVVESGRIDGCNELRIFLQLVMPFVLPGMLTLGVLAFFGSWNSYLTPSIILNRPDLYTIPVGMSALGNEYRNDNAARILGITMGLFPLILLYITNSKYFIGGLTAGAVKG